jgi:hypothetical protein
MSKRPHKSQSSQGTLGTVLRLRRALSRHSPSPTPPGQSESESAAVVPSVNAPQPQPLPGPANSSGSPSLPADGAHAPQSQSSPAGDDNINHFHSLLSHADASRTMLEDIGCAAYEGFKGAVAVADAVGYALPPLKAAAAGAGRIMTVYDVCIPRSK